MTKSSKPSAILKRSIVIAGHKTSVSLENEFWIHLKNFASAKNQSLSTYVGAIDVDRESNNLSSTLRLHVLGQVSADRESFKRMMLIGSAATGDQNAGSGDRTASERLSEKPDRRFERPFKRVP